MMFIYDGSWQCLYILTMISIHSQSMGDRSDHSRLVVVNHCELRINGGWLTTTWYSIRWPQVNISTAWCSFCSCSCCPYFLPHRRCGERAQISHSPPCCGTMYDFPTFLNHHIPNSYCHKLRFCYKQGSPSVPCIGDVPIPHFAQISGFSSRQGMEASHQTALPAGGRAGTRQC